MKKMNSSGLLATARQRLQLNAAMAWRPVVYTLDIDGLMAEMALDEDKPEVSEAAARAIGRIRSEAAVKVLAEHQLKGERQALRALALVRDEAPSLPKSVSRQARLYAWLANTVRRLSDHPMRAVWRYVFAVIFAGLGVWGYTFAEISSAAIFFAERWGKSLTTGITFGVVFGLVVLMGGETPARLRGFWPWWARLLLSAVLGLAAGILVWVVFVWFFLYYPPDDFHGIIIGGIGAALAFVPSVLFDCPGWIGAIWTALAIYLPLYVTWINYMPPLMYTRPGEHINEYAIPIAILIGVGAYLPQLVNDGRKLWRRVRSRPAAVVEQPATTVG
jgi:hypothetical protein